MQCVSFDIHNKKNPSKFLSNNFTLADLLFITGQRWSTVPKTRFVYKYNYDLAYESSWLHTVNRLIHDDMITRQLYTEIVEESVNHKYSVLTVQ